VRSLSIAEAMMESADGAFVKGEFAFRRFGSTSTPLVVRAQRPTL